jgi:hypothetical protein
MPTRPIALQGSEELKSSDQNPDPGFRFDGSVGVWRDTAGGLAVRFADPSSSRVTATREGVDQTERAGGGGTRITETREGVDQAERAN